MAYESPINIVYGKMQLEFEDKLIKAVLDLGIYADKEQLIKALRYDRDQYQKGYNDRDSEIIKCKDCKYCVIAEDHVSYRSILLFYLVSATLPRIHNPGSRRQPDLQNSRLTGLL